MVTASLWRPVIAIADRYNSVPVRGEPYLITVLNLHFQRPVITVWNQMTNGTLPGKTHPFDHVRFGAHKVNITRRQLLYDINDSDMIFLLYMHG